MTAEEDRFAELMRAHGPGLSRIVQSYARPGADQADLGQEIALAIWRALPASRSECSERTFLYRVAHNRALTFLARRRLRDGERDELPDVLDDGPGPEARAAQREGVARLFRALRALPVSYRQVLALALEDLSHAEIAAFLGISAGNVAMRLGRARAALRARWEQP